MSASASSEALKWNGRIAFSSLAAALELLPELAGDGLCDQEDEVNPRRVTIMGSAFFMTGFLVEVKEARPETRSPVTANREALASHLYLADEAKTRRWRVKIDIRSAIYPGEPHLKSTTKDAS
jgi:hypothetical protein